MRTRQGERLRVAHASSALGECSSKTSRARSTKDLRSNKDGPDLRPKPPIFWHKTSICAETRACRACSSRDPSRAWPTKSCRDASRKASQLGKNSKAATVWRQRSAEHPGNCSRNRAASSSHRARLGGVMGVCAATNDIRGTEGSVNRSAFFAKRQIFSIVKVSFYTRRVAISTIFSHLFDGHTRRKIKNGDLTQIPPIPRSRLSTKRYCTDS
jgi:hypothetical protein